MEQSAFRRIEGMVIKHYKLKGRADTMQMGTYKSRPGEYFHPNGKPATEEEAAAAGFKVEFDQRKRVAVDKVNAAVAESEAELKKLRAEADAVQSETVNTSASEPVPEYDMALRESPLWRMTYENKTQLWSIIDKKTDEVSASDLTKIEAAKILHEDIHAGGA